ncbi:MAG: NAD(P)-dependent oxidoreductase [Deltaproteobacteria bacterium]|nr:NAD(P)-dependent oxidoreductase [Deltaproteobacteria bacterium]
MTRATRDEKLLITGAAGFTGHHAVIEAVKAGFSVRATDVSSRYYSAMFEALGVEFVKADLTQRDGLEVLLDGIDGVFHVAGIHDYSTPRELMVAVNVNAVENLCDACASAGVERFIHLSSAGVYGYDWHDKTPVKEDASKLTPPLNVYNETYDPAQSMVHGRNTASITRSNTSTPSVTKRGSRCWEVVTTSKASSTWRTCAAR